MRSGSSSGASDATERFGVDQLKALAVLIGLATFGALVLLAVIGFAAALGILVVGALMLALIAYGGATRRQ